MGYQNIEELKQFPKSRAKDLYQIAYSRFKTTEVVGYFKLALLGPVIAALGAGIGFHYWNETHLGVYFAVIGALIGHYLMLRLVERKMKPYVKEVVNESSR